MAVEIIVLSQRSRMFCHARRKQIRQQSRHDCWTNEVIEPLQSLLKQPAVYVVKQIINVLHGDLEIFEPQLEGEAGVQVEAFTLRPIPLRRHTRQDTMSKQSEQDQSAKSEPSADNTRILRY